MGRPAEAIGPERWWRSRRRRFDPVLPTTTVAVQLVHRYLAEQREAIAAALVERTR